MKKTKIRLLICGTTLGFGLAIGKMSYNNMKIHKALDKQIEQVNKLSKDTIDLKNNLIKINKLNKQQNNKINKLQKEIEEKEQYIKEITKRISYNPDNIKEKSNATLIHMKKALNNTTMKGLAPYFIEAEKEYGVNALFLAGLVATESGWNKSSLATKQNNLTGHCMYNNFSRGSIFNTKRECILDTAKLLKEHYLNPKGKYYHGKSIWEINQEYCLKNKKPNMKWSKNINSIAYDFLNKANKNI